MQAKRRITPSQAIGCDVAAALDLNHLNHGGGNSRAVNAIATCSGNAFGDAHFNLGGNKSGSTFNRNWGVAVEKELSRLTPHVEWFGERGSHPTFQVGARTDVARGVQLDGSLGRSAGQALYSLGFKLSF